MKTKQCSFNCGYTSVLFQDPFSPEIDPVDAAYGAWSQAQRWGTEACGSLEGWIWCARSHGADQAQTPTRASAARCSIWTSRLQKHEMAWGGRATAPGEDGVHIFLIPSDKTTTMIIRWYTWRMTVFFSDGGCSPRIRVTSSSFWALWSLESVWAVKDPSSSCTPSTARASPALAINLQKQKMDRSSNLQSYNPVTQRVCVCVLIYPPYKSDPSTWATQAVAPEKATLSTQ